MRPFTMVASLGAGWLSASDAARFVGGGARRIITEKAEADKERCGD